MAKKTARPAKVKMVSAKVKEAGALKSKPRLKPGLITKSSMAFTVAAGAKGKKLARELFDEKKAAMPRLAGWPADCVADDRHCSWLPQDWTAALRLTDKMAGRPGGGGLLLHCYVGPAPKRKRLFHKKDVEAYLGRKLDFNERGPKTKVLAKHLREELPPDNFIKRTAVSCETQYINDRCDGAHGMRVSEAIASLTYKHRNGKVRNYTSADMKYDMKGGRIELTKQRPGKLLQQSSAQKVAAPKQAAPAAKSKPLKLRRSSAAAVSKAGAAAATKASQPAEAAASASAAKRRRSAPAAAASQPVEAAASASAAKRRRSAPAAAVLQGTSGSAPASSSSSSSAPSAGELVSIKKLVYEPLLKKAAKGVEGEAAIYSLIGIGKCYEFDDTMLKILPDVLRKEPKARGPIGDITLRQFEQELRQASGRR